jgi:triacylglycerol esterase/lipase EstA (alpha/beta hydrolase family)
VARYVSLGTPQHGTAAANLINMFAGCFTINACEQMQTGSAFLSSLNAAGETPGDVSYTAIATTEDELVVPYTNAFLVGHATNVTLQQFCWARVVGHAGLVLDAAVAGLIVHTLKGETLTTDCWAW